jgi:hypothetical protein
MLTVAAAAAVGALVARFASRRLQRYPPELRLRGSSSEGYRRLRVELDRRARDGEPAEPDATD